MGGNCRGRRRRCGCLGVGASRPIRHGYLTLRTDAQAERHHRRDSSPLPPGRRFLRALPWVAKLLISGGLIWYLLAEIGVADTVERARSLPVLTLAAAFLLISGQCVLGGIRWKLVILAIGAYLGLGKAVQITFVGLFFNQFLPASLGADLVRMWQSTRAGLPVAAAVTTVMLERFGNLLSIFAMALLTLPVLGTYTNAGGAQKVIALASLGGAAALILLMFLDRLPENWRRWRIVRGMVHLARDARALFLKPRYALLVFLTAVAGQIALAAAVWLIALGLAIDVRFIDCLVLMPPVVLVSSLPISVAGWGVRELAMVGAFGMLGVPGESALALSVILALTATAVSLPGGVIWLWLRSAAREAAARSVPSGSKE